MDQIADRLRRHEADHLPALRRSRRPGARHGAALRRLSSSARSPRSSLDGTTPNALLESTIDAYLELLEHDTNLYRFLSMHEPGKRDLVAGLIADEVAVVLDRYLTAAGLDTTSAKPWAYGLVGMVHFAGDWWTRAGTPDRSTLVRQLTALALVGLRGYRPRQSTSRRSSPSRSTDMTSTEMTGTDDDEHGPRRRRRRHHPFHVGLRAVAAPQLTKLYEKGKTSQWNATTDIDWTPEVNFGEPDPEIDRRGRSGRCSTSSWASARLTRRSQVQRRRDERSSAGSSSPGWSASSCTASRVRSWPPPAWSRRCPTSTRKYYAANQVADEARHVEAYARYLNDKLQAQLRDQQAARVAPRRHHDREAVGHHLPRHADHGRGPRARRVRPGQRVVPRRRSSSRSPTT